jgi:hypothetical protein
VDGSVTQRRYRWRVYAAVPRGDVYFCFGVAYVSRSLIGEAREFAASARCYSRVHRYSVRVHSDVYSTRPPCVIIYGPQFRPRFTLHSFQFGLEHMKLMMMLIITRTLFPNRTVCSSGNTQVARFRPIGFA